MKYSIQIIIIAGALGLIMISPVSSITGNGYLNYWEREDPSAYWYKIGDTDGLSLIRAYRWLDESWSFDWQQGYYEGQTTEDWFWLPKPLDYHWRYDIYDWAGGVSRYDSTWYISKGNPTHPSRNSPVASVGGIVVSIDKFGLLAPYIGLASTIIVATVAAAIYVKRVKHRKEKQ